MTLNQLQYVVALDNFRHFALAADNCFVTQPTLSMQVHKLEEELGVIIFDRTKQPVVPTDIGRKIINQARIILQESERLQNIIANETGEFTGTLRIGVIPTITPYLIPLFLKTFVIKYPKIELIINEIETDKIIKGINKDLIDVGLLALPINNLDIQEIPLYYEPFLAYVSRNHFLFKKEKLTLDDLTKEGLLLLKEGHCLREQTLKICKKGERNCNDENRKLLFESGNLETLQKLVEQNFGFTLLPFLAVKDIENKDKLSLVREFLPPVPKREIGLVHSKAFLKKHLIEALLNEIIKVIPKSLMKTDESFIIN